MVQEQTKQEAKFSTFARKEKTVEAFQWYPDIETDLVEIRKPRVVISEDGAYYYIEHLDKQSMCWLSFKELPGPVSKEKQRDKPHGWVQFAQKDGADVYHRKVLPFVYFQNIKPKQNQESIPLLPNSKLLFDFAYANDWQDTSLAVKTGLVESNGNLLMIKPGDFIVKDGEAIHCLAEKVFLENYGAVN